MRFGGGEFKKGVVAHDKVAKAVENARRHLRDSKSPEELAQLPAV